MAASLHVLVLESEPGAADAAIEELRAAGHSVVRCHEPGAPAFPCSGVVEREGCPLVSVPIDLALTVRSGAPMHPTPTEDGVSCALRNRIPVVVTGDVVFDPYEGYATTVEGGTGRVVEACERTARQPLSAHSSLAERVVAELLDRNGIVGARRAVVHRRAGGLVVTLDMPGATPRDVRNLAAVRVLDALRAFDPSASAIDVTMTATQ